MAMATKNSLREHISASVERMREASAEAKSDERKFHHERSMKQFEFTQQGGWAAAKGALLLNGGAAGALLALLGNLLANQPDSLTTRVLAAQLYPFVAGMLFAGLISACLFMGQAGHLKANCTSDKATKAELGKWGTYCNTGSAICLVLAYACFAVGSWKCVSTLSQLNFAKSSKVEIRAPAQ
jgi:hypothetical protein